ncbi:MAG: hypothetical protein ACYC97_07855 [Metallibacterium sp.]
MKPRPHPEVRTWLDDQVAETLYLSSVTLAELLFGIGALPTADVRTHWLKRWMGCWNCSGIGFLRSTRTQPGIMPSWP